MNLAQMLLTQGNVDRVASRFDLSQDEAAEAIQSLLPAFSEGLKRQTSTSQGAVDLLSALAGGGHARYADNPDKAMRKRGRREGNAILGHLFGRKKVSRAVARQAAETSGVSSSILKELLPMLAPMVMGALFKNSVGGGGATTQAGQGGGGLLGTIMDGLINGMASGAEPTRRRSRRGSGLEDLLGAALGGGSSRRRQRSRTTTRRRRSSGGGLGDLLGDLLGGGETQSARRSSTADRPSKRARHRDPVMPPKRRQRRASRQLRPQDVFGDMLEPGADVSATHQRKTRDVFDQLLGG
ncbi:MAG: DUF937 domain-containing protein [Ahrensia sp.]|nr:DUF937 domain-containing protein [Ahrensia sp.]